MLEVILGFGFLFNPMGFITPAHRIEVIHFGHPVQLAVFDTAFEKAAEPWKSDPIWGWMAQGNIISASTRVMVTSFYARTPECLREVEWSVVQTVGPASLLGLGYTIVLNPRLLNADTMEPTLVAAFSKVFQIISLRAQPVSTLVAACAD